MIPKHAIEAIDRMLRDISNSNVPFAGKVILLGGDFRQTLPVVKRARPAEVIEVCLKSSYIWPCLLYTSPSPRDGLLSRMPSSA